jgi:hypothetical protein
MQSEALVQRATVYTRDQFKQSPAQQRIGEDAAIEAMDSYELMGQRLFSDKAKLSLFIGMLAGHAYDRLIARQGVSP